MSRIWWGECCFVWGGRLEQVPDAACEVALEAADHVAVGLALGAFAGDVGLGLVVAAGAGDRDAMNGGVDLAVAAAVEAVAGSSPVASSTNASLTAGVSFLSGRGPVSLG